MAQNVTFNGTSYIIPEQGESSWGTNVTSYLVAIASHALQKTGGSFTLTADVDFGATYGLRAVKFASRNTPSTTGIFRLGNNESVAWRNAANGADIALKVNASDVLEFNGNPIFTLALGAANTVLKMNSGGTAYEFGKIANDNVSDSAAIAWSKIDKTGSNLTDIATRSHTSLSDIGTNSHTDIDTALSSAASHASSTSNPHSVTATQVGLGNVDNTSDATKNAASVSLTNKTIVEPVIDNFADFNEESAPGSPSAGKLRVYAKADKKLYKKDSDGLESEVGSGGAGGGRNYLSDWFDATKDIGTVTNSLTDVVDTSDRTANKTTWGSSDTSLLTIARSSSSPLRQAYSYLITEAGSSAGAFVESPLFSLDSVDLGKPVTVSFDVSGNSTSDYYQVYVCRYDSDDVLKERILIAGTASATSPYSARIPTGTVNFQGFFIPSSTSTDQYALRIVSNNNSADSIKIDSLYIGPQNVVQGAAVTDWKPYAPGNTQGLGTITNNTLEWMQDGPNLYLRGDFFTGTVANSEVQLGLPNNFVIGGNATSSQVIGQIESDSTQGATRSRRFQLLATKGDTYLNVGIDLSDANENVTTPANGSSIFASTTRLTLFAGPIPIVGWSSNVTMANRAVEEYAYNTNTTTSDDTTSFGYGADGVAFGSFTSNTTSVTTKRVRFTTPIQPTDRIEVEIKHPSGYWIPVGQYGFGYVAQGTSAYGIAMITVNATDVDIQFGKKGARPTNATYAGDGAAWSGYTDRNWRVRKVSGGASVGYPVSARNIVGDTSGTAVPSGFIGEATKNTYTAAATTTISTGSAFTVQPGNYMVHTVVGISTAASVTGCYGGYSTDSGATSFSDYSVVGATPNVVAMVCTATLDAVGSTSIPVNITTPTTYYPKLKTYGAGATMRVTITFERIG